MDMRKIKPVLIIPVIFIGMLLFGCSGSPPVEKAGTTDVRILISRNFGQELMLDKTINIQSGQDALQILKVAAEVDTSYGGGFVSSINGIASQYGGIKSGRQDWFFYINGLMSNIGAVDYILHGGDVELWDFHEWSFHQFTPAVTACFPEPFLHGFGEDVRPTVIVCGSDFQNIADRLMKKLKDSGVQEIGIENAAGLTHENKESSNIILLNTFGDSLIMELNKEWKRLGFWAYFEDGQLVLLDSRGQISVSLGNNSGLIQATQNPWNPDGIGASENTVWVITGTDIKGVKLAAEALLDSGETEGSFAAAVSEGKIFRLPLP
jgi:hypothetical protein